MNSSKALATPVSSSLSVSEDWSSAMHWHEQAGSSDGGKLAVSAIVEVINVWNIISQVKYANLFHLHMQSQINELAN